MHSYTVQLEGGLLSTRTRAIALAAITLLVVVVCWFLPPIPQPLDYHNFTDERSWLGIANFGDVVSNLAFAIFGIWGVIYLLAQSPEQRAKSFIHPVERWPYVVAFAGMILTALGSGYYHLAPDNERLVWDRLPMTIVFMSMVAAVIAERISVKLGLMLWPLLLIIGAASVWQWHMSELRGHGDLRFYAGVQAYAILVLLVMLFFRSPYTRAGDFGVVVGFYVLAKLLETGDRHVFALGHIVSGHTLKHIAAAFAGYWILRMLQLRSPRSGNIN